MRGVGDEELKVCVALVDVEYGLECPEVEGGVEGMDGKFSLLDFDQEETVDLGVNLETAPKHWAF